MSLAIAIKAPEGLVLATESRVTYSRKVNEGTIYGYLDNATKLFSFEQQPGIGVVTYGLGAFGAQNARTAQSYMPEFNQELKTGRSTVVDFVEKLYKFFSDRWEETMPQNWEGVGMKFFIGGFDKPESIYGRIYDISIPSKVSSFDKCEIQFGGDFGVRMGGAAYIAERILIGYDQRTLKFTADALSLNEDQVKAMKESLGSLGLAFPWASAPLQDCVDLAIFLIKTSKAAQDFSVDYRPCGGPIDVAYITRTQGLIFVQHKEIIGERDKE